MCGRFKNIEDRVGMLELRMSERKKMEETLVLDDRLRGQIENIEERILEKSQFMGEKFQEQLKEI